MADRWIVNASPLILLGKAGQLDWISKLGDVIIPESVAGEIKAGPQGDPARRWIENGEGGCLVRRDAEASDDLKGWDLGAGETAVIAWGIFGGLNRVVLDDGAARRCARIFGLEVRGTLSLVAIAKRKGHVKLCRPIFEKLLSEGFFITRDLIEQVANSVGE